MQIPDPIRTALRKASLTPHAWRSILAAFAAIPEPVPNTDGSLESMRVAALNLAIAERMRAISALPGDGQLSWDGMQEKLFRDLWTIWGAEGPLKFAERFGVAKTTVYRKLRELGLPSTTEMLQQQKRIETASEIEVEIARLQRKLEELQSAEVAA